jgi:hypothetical protein
MIEELMSYDIERETAIYLLEANEFESIEKALEYKSAKDENGHIIH